MFEFEVADSRAERQRKDTDESSVPSIGTLIAGKYRVEGQLGSGGMGVVLSARHEALGQRVAIKFLSVGDEEHRAQAAERLLREARAVAALRGEHVVRIYDVGEHEPGVPFIVMEYLEGEDLGQILRRTGKLPVSDAAALVAQACRAVAEAHEQAIVHRDLKPSNLFVVRHPDGSATVKVVDFGIAKSTRSGPAPENTLTTQRTALGSPYYMSPEQVRDAHEVDARTDVWSLGVILYELLAGRPAFQASTFSGVFAAIVSDSPPSVSALRPEVPPALEQLLLRCLERQPDARLQSAAEFSAMLAPFAARHVDYARLTQRLPAVRASAVPEASGARTLDTIPIGSQHALAKEPTQTQASPVALPAFEPTSVAGVVHSVGAASLATATQRSPSPESEQARRAPRRAALVLALLALFGGVVWAITRASAARDAPALPAASAVATALAVPPPSAGKIAEPSGAEVATPPSASVAPAASAYPGAAAGKGSAKGSSPRASQPAASVEKPPEIRLMR